MIVSSSIVAQAKQRGRKQIAQTAPPGERLTNPADVVDVLAEATSPAAQRGARGLLQQMAMVAWSVIRGVHSSKSDGTPHVLLDIDGARYHLRLDGQGNVFDITRVIDKQTQRPSGRKPWVGPGA